MTNLQFCLMIGVPTLTVIFATVIAGIHRHRFLDQMLRRFDLSEERMGISPPDRESHVLYTRAHRDR